MAQITAKMVKEHFSRASAYAGRGEAVKALGAACEGLKSLVLAKTVFGRERFEAEMLLRDFLTLLPDLPEVAAILPSKPPYAKGTEKKLYLLLDRVRGMIEAESAAKSAKEEKNREGRFIDAMGKARMYLDRKEYPTARNILNRVCEEFAERQGVLLDAGRMLLDAGLPAEALVFFNKSVETSPREGRAYAGAVDCLLALGETAKAEALLKTALREFGASPGVYLALARLYVDTRKWDKAYDALTSILDREPRHEQALELMRRVEPKMSLGGSPSREKKGIVIDMPKF